ncbi:MAG: phenylacetate-CoA oxygenase subunit PaaI [Crocinitomicaceae bacterium]|nr:phenylacetate-CoA oxygenase subunit PaaI [Crocinitomicaceae bacterium]|tara:strand:+ start:1826 stop:2581 length:756 start_codon:yes stop_codon:yes gene_type:complete
MANENASLLLWLADDALILGQRLSEWCGHAAVLEEDIALSNVALDLIGQARALLTLAGQEENQERDEDQLAYFRTDRDYRNLLLLELPNGDFGDTIARQFLFDQFSMLRYEALAKQTANPEVAAIASKAIKEVRYHAAHSAKWIIRLGDGTDESKSRIQKSIDKLWEYTGEFFMDYGCAQAWTDQGVLPSLQSFEQPWLDGVSAILREATLDIPESKWMQKGGRTGYHTEHLSYLLAEMQVLPRTYPNAKW